MKKFLKTCIDSIVSFDFYAQLWQEPFWQSARFYLFFLIVAAILHTLPIYISTIPQLQQVIQSSLQEWQERHPSDVTLHWTGERLKSEPLTIAVPYPQAVEQYLAHESLPPLLAYISTNPDTTLPNLDAIVTVTSTDILLPATSGEIAQTKIVDVLGKNQLEVNKETSVQIQNWWNEKKQTIILSMATVTPLFFYCALFIQRVLQLLIESLFFFLFKRLFGQGWSYTKCLQYAIHFFVPAEIIGLLASYSFPSSPLSFFSLTVWLYFVAVLIMPRPRVNIRR